MAFSLLNWASSDGHSRKKASDLVTDPAKVAALLQQIIDERINLKISLPGTNETYNSTIFAVDKKNMVFDIDELMPRNGHDILTKQKKLSVKGQGHGPMIIFSATLVSTGKSSGAQYYKMQFPKSIKYTERRGMFRAKIGSAKRLDVSCRYEGKSLSGYVYDVSGKGVALILNDAPKLSLKETLDGCKINLHNEGILNFDFGIRHLRSLGNSRTLLGGNFKKLGTEQRKMIGKYVRAIERDSLAKRRKDT